MEFPEEDLARLNLALGLSKNLSEQLEANKNRVGDLYPWTQSSDLSELTGFIHASDDLSPELRNLASLTKINYLPVVVNYLTNAMSVAGISRDGTAYTPAWEQWQATNMPNKEKWIYNNAFSFAESIIVIGFGTDGRPAVRVTNPSKIAGFKFNWNDDVPSYVMEQVNAKDAIYDIYDDKYIYRVKIQPSSTVPELQSITIHGFNVIPVVSYLNDFDWVREVSVGEIGPYINAQKLIFKSLWDAQATSHSQGFKVRYITGVEFPEEEVDDDGNPTTERAKKYLQQIRMDSLIVAPNKDARIGVLPETSIDGLLKNVEANVQHLATTSNTPFFVLQQQVANISTDTANVMTQNTRNKIRDRRLRFGAAHRRLISLYMFVLGEDVKPEEISITWAATDPVQMGAFMDALGKGVAMLKIPYRATWNKLQDIGFTPEDIAYAIELDDEAQRQNNALMGSVLGAQADMDNAGLPEPGDDSEAADGLVA